MPFTSPKGQELLKRGAADDDRAAVIKSAEAFIVRTPADQFELLERIRRSRRRFERRFTAIGFDNDRRGGNDALIKRPFALSRSARLPHAVIVALRIAA